MEIIVTKPLKTKLQRNLTPALADARVIEAFIKASTEMVRLQFKTRENAIAARHLLYRVRKRLVSQAAKEPNNPVLAEQAAAALTVSISLSNNALVMATTSEGLLDALETAGIFVSADDTTSKPTLFDGEDLVAVDDEETDISYKNL
jgi:PDZ domain-containing secreted protein